MTRINLVPPQELTDQHLFAEFREIKMIPKSLRRSLEAARKHGRGLRIPGQYTLNTGHVSFFYDKGLYLQKRYELLKDELRDRGFVFNENSPLDPDGVYEQNELLMGDYTPTPEALEIVRERIALRIADKPWWYRMRGVPLA